MPLLGAGLLAMYYLLTLYLQLVRGYSALHTGLAYLPNVVGLGLAAGGLGPRLLAALPPRAVIAAGMLVSGVAAGLLNTSVQCGAALGLGALAAIASAVTRSQQAGHTHAAALTNGYVAGLLTGAAIYAVGAIVAALTINARLSPDELAGH